MAGPREAVRLLLITPFLCSTGTEAAGTRSHRLSRSAQHESVLLALGVGGLSGLQRRGPGRQGHTTGSRGGPLLRCSRLREAGCWLVAPSSMLVTRHVAPFSLTLTCLPPSWDPGDGAGLAAGTPSVRSLASSPLHSPLGHIPCLARSLAIRMRTSLGPLSPPPEVLCHRGCSRAMLQCSGPEPGMRLRDCRDPK